MQPDLTGSAESDPEMSHIKYALKSALFHHAKCINEGNFMESESKGVENKGFCAINLVSMERGKLVIGDLLFQTGTLQK